jgi:hypothetical protein
MKDDDRASSPTDFTALARDWIAIWEHALAASVHDPEAQEFWRLLFDAAIAPLRAAADASPAQPEHGTDSPPLGAATLTAASRSRDAALERLACRVASLEARVTALEERCRRAG